MGRPSVSRCSFDDAIYLKENMEERFGVKEVVIGK